MLLKELKNWVGWGGGTAVQYLLTWVFDIMKAHS